MQPTEIPPKTPRTVSAPASGRRWGIFLLVIILTGHTWLASRLFPSWASIIDPRTPVVVVDHAIHEYHGSLGAQFLAQTGTSWGYDPYFMAGYPETPVWDSSSNLAIIFNLLGGGGETSFRGYKVGLCATLILALVAVAVAVRLVGDGWATAALATGLVGGYFWVGYPISLWRSGLFAFLTAAIGTPLLLALCVRFDRKPTWQGWVALGGVASGLFFCHVTTPIMVGPGALAFYLLVARRHGRRWHMAILGAVGFTVLVNLVWLVPLWRFRGLRVGSGFFMTTTSYRFLFDYYLSRSVDSRLGLVLLMLGSAGIMGWWFSGRRPAAVAFGGSVAALIWLTGFGSFWEVTKVLEPLRFRVAFCYLLAVPAASGLMIGSMTLARWLRGGVGGWAMVVGAWIMVLGTWGYLEPTFFWVVKSWLLQDRPFVVGYPPQTAPLVDWLRRETDLSARVLFEDQLRLLEGTDAESTHWTPLLPGLLAPDDRLFIGGLYQTAFIQHHQQASFGDFHLGDRSIDEWTSAELARFTEQYNVGWVVCWSPLSRFVFDHLAGATRVKTLPRFATPGRPPANNDYERTAIIRLGGVRLAQKYILEGESTYAVYRLTRPHSYFLRGKGRVVAVAPNRIELADIEPDATGVAVLSMHWLDTFRADPPATIGPEPAPPDPVPFLRIETKQPIPHLVLRNKYGR